MNLNSEIIYLKNELNNKNKIIENLQNQLSNLNNLYNNNLSLIEKYKNALNQKEQELQQLKDNLNSNSYKNNNDSKNKYGFAIIFDSINQEIHYPMVCNENDLISRLEEELYNEYPKYKDYNTYLTCHGTVLKRFKTIKDNNIKRGDAILVNIFE